MKLIALKDLPQGTKPGEAFEANDDIGNVLILIGAARRVTRADASQASPGAAEDETAKGPDSPRRYQRRDLQAKG